MVMERVPKNWSPNRYDIVLVPYEDDVLCKRVIGIPGDFIEVKEGEIFLNDRKLDDPYGDGDPISYILADEDDQELYYWGTNEMVIKLVDEKKLKVREGSIWCIGDNRDVSHYGLFFTKDIKGKIVL
jgi:signal peptidase I